MFADILILRPESNHDQVLTYSLPENESGVVVGSLVLVPVRQHIEKGIVLKINRERPAIRGYIKPIKQAVEKDPVLTSQALELVYWISEYYICSLNKAVHLFLPPPVRQQERKILVTGPEKSSDRLFIGETEQKILEYINEKTDPKAVQGEIFRRFGPGSGNALNNLIKNNMLSIKTEFVPRTVAKEKKIIAVTTIAPKWQEIKKKAPRQGEILKLLQERPINYDELKEVCGQIQPALKALQKKGWVEVRERTELRSPYTSRLRSERAYILNTNQQEASEKICRSIRNKEEKEWLLFGVTGSGKTEVYLRAIEEILNTGRQALYLVPEIALTPQITSVLLDAFGERVALLHSSLTPGERYDEWMRIRRGEASVVLGPRSAVFAPFTDLGLVIIDEEHENTYKQSEPDPRYDARRTARKLAEIFKAELVMGSATPSLQAFSKAKKGEYELLRLPYRVKARPLPAVEIIDMKKENSEGNSGIFSRRLLTELERVVQNGEQAILFMNRRGFHTYVLCRECGKSLTCPRCAISLTYHHNNKKLACHYCNYQRPVPQKCPFCGSVFMHFFGTGTERVTRELVKLLPQARILRMDADTTQKKGSHTAILKEFQEGKAQILIGTQMIAKGLDFPAVTLVGIINADVLINMPDYQASERAYQLLTQVAGRAGRGGQPGNVVVQTYDPAHYLFQAVISQDYEEFYNKEMINRDLLQYPPYHKLIRVVVSGFQEKITWERVEYLAKMLKIEIEKKKWDQEVFGPCPAPLSYLKGRFRYHLIIKGIDLEKLQVLARGVRIRAGQLSMEPRMIIDVEPQNLL